MTTVNLTTETISVTKRLPRYISLEKFRASYSDIEDEYKYEWNNGKIEKTKNIKYYQAFLEILLLRLFVQTNAFRLGGGICAEMETMTSKLQLRKPDLAFYTSEQLRIMRTKQFQIPTWVAEIISDTNDMVEVENKMLEYFNAGVQVVWHIIPQKEVVYVYTSPNDVTICRGETICSGAPILPDFQISAKDLFEEN